MAVVVAMAGCGLVVLGFTGLLLGALRSPRRGPRPEGLDIYGLWFWYEHRSWCWKMIPAGALLVLAMLPFQSQ